MHYDTDYSGYFFADDENAHVNYNSEKKLELADASTTYTVTVRTMATAAAAQLHNCCGWHWDHSERHCQQRLPLQGWQVVSGDVTISGNKFAMPTDSVEGQGDLRGRYLHRYREQ